MPSKPGPYIFIFTLITVLLFIIGFRWGGQVEKANKAINFFLSLPPTKPPAPTSPPLEFKTYTHQECGLSFLYPAFFKIEKESSITATLKNENKFLNFNCKKNNSLEPTIDPKYKTFEKLNPKNNKNIVFVVEKSLLPLLEKSLEFTN